VFYDALGHFPQTWQDRRQLALAAGGIEWTLRLAPAGGC
jgi:type 1 glutamine amidotransferase